MKKILALSLVVVMAFSLFACTGTKDDAEPTPDETPIVTDDVDYTDENDVIDDTTTDEPGDDGDTTDSDNPVDDTLLDDVQDDVTDVDTPVDDTLAGDTQDDATDADADTDTSAE